MTRAPGAIRRGSWFWCDRPRRIRRCVQTTQLRIQRGNIEQNAAAAPALGDAWQAYDESGRVPMNQLKGQCLCGEVTYRCACEPITTGLCHCKKCQRQSGSSFSVNVVVPRGSVTVEGSAATIRDSIGGSGLSVGRIFCGSCGSTVLTYTDAIPEWEFIKAGTLDDTSVVKPTLEIWCEDAQSWVVQAWVKPEESRQRVDRNLPRPA
jgi:hypothetical protein